jgi:GT2 family glycosyltransferase
MPKTKISVIIGNWNNSKVIANCLISLKKSINGITNEAIVDVIVVDDASTDGAPDLIARKFPWVKLYRLNTNQGFAKSNNFGIKKADKNTDFYLLLNNDAYIRDDTLSKALQFMQKYQNCDVLGCRLEFEDGRFQPSAGYLPTPSSTTAWIWGLNFIPLINKFFKPVHPKYQDFFIKDREVGWVMGAFLFMRNNVIIKTKGFDDNFYMYMEEVEWCKRIEDSGFHIWYTPSFTITHLDKASAMGDPVRLAKIFRLEIVGLKYYLKRHYNEHTIWLFPIIKLGTIVRYIIFLLLGNKLRQEAYWNTLKEL